LSVIVDQSSWGQLEVTGADRVRFLQGMVTNDIAGLAPGQFRRAALLNVKGRVLAIVDVVEEGESLLEITEPVTADKVRALLEKHAIADDVTFTPVARAIHRVWDSIDAVWSAPPVFAPPPSTSSEAEIDVLRVEAGLPRYGVDVSEDHFPFEAHLEPAISMTRGCYIGQEVVARASARGHANKLLRGLRLASDAPVAGATIAAAGRDDAGKVTSQVVSPRFGPIALAYVHKSAWDPGTEVRVGEQTATVVELPFR
jgi:folate-binding protein YgfZ